jgi:hypothetical protein
MGDLPTVGSSLLSMRLHRDMRVEMVQGTVSLFTAIPPAFVHALDFFIPPAGSLMLLGPRNWDKRIDLQAENHVLIEKGLPNSPLSNERCKCPCPGPHRPYFTALGRAQ